MSFSSLAVAASVQHSIGFPSWACCPDPVKHGVPSGSGPASDSPIFSSLAAAWKVADTHSEGLRTLTVGGPGPKRGRDRSRSGDRPASDSSPREPVFERKVGSTTLSMGETSSIGRLGNSAERPAIDGRGGTFSAVRLGASVPLLATAIHSTPATPTGRRGARLGANGDWTDELTGETSGGCTGPIQKTR